MFERSDLERLAAYEGKHPVVSLYLNMDPRLRDTRDAYRARLKGLLKQISGRAPAADIAAIEEYFEKEFDWSGRSVAVFCSQGGNLWEVQRFAVPLRSTVHVNSKPFLMPLARLMDSYGSYSVALVDKQTIRMFYFHLGELIHAEKLEGADIRQVKGGGGSGMGASGSRGLDISRHVREQVRDNLNDFAEAFAAFCTRHKVEHILIGGVDENVQAFRDALRNPWQDRIAGVFTIPIRAPEGEVLARSLEIMQAKEREREQRLVERLVTQAAKGANGVVGLGPTLEAVEAGRVQTLVLVEGALEPEVADPAIVRTVDYGGEVEFVDSNISPAILDGIGALLRY